MTKGTKALIVIVLAVGLIVSLRSCLCRIAERACKGTGSECPGEPQQPPAKELWAARPCRADVYAVDVPIWAEPSWPNNDFLPQIGLELTRTMGRTRSWFCG